MSTTINKNAIQIDGSYGEGGGQILRTSLTLSMITGIPIHIINIRAKRKKPGLMRQHLVCVEASTRISNAAVTGASLGSGELHFTPQAVQAGQYEFQIGSAGSTMLVLQTLLPALLLADKPTKVSVSGGTHNPMAPTADFIKHCFLPTVRAMGIMVDFELEQAGFAPVGGGKITATIHPWTIRQGLDLSGVNKTGKPIKLGTKPNISAYASALNLADHIAVRELDTLANLLPINERKPFHMQGSSQGNTVFVNVSYPIESSLNILEFTQVFTALGEYKKSAETVAKQLAKKVKKYLKSEALVDEYLADQLLLPLALGRGGKFTATTISQHTQTQADMIAKFIDCDIKFTEMGDKCWLVEVMR